MLVPDGEILVETITAWLAEWNLVKDRAPELLAEQIDDDQILEETQDLLAVMVRLFIETACSRQKVNGLSQAAINCARTPAVQNLVQQHAGGLFEADDGLDDMVRHRLLSRSRRFEQLGPEPVEMLYEPLLFESYRAADEYHQGIHEHPLAKDPHRFVFGVIKHALERERMRAGRRDRRHQGEQPHDGVLEAGQAPVRAAPGGRLEAAKGFHALSHCEALADVVSAGGLPKATLSSLGLMLFRETAKYPECLRHAWLEPLLELPMAGAQGYVLIRQDGESARFRDWFDLLQATPEYQHVDAAMQARYQRIHAPDEPQARAVGGIYGADPDGALHNFRGLSSQWVIEMLASRGWRCAWRNAAALDQAYHRARVEVLGALNDHFGGAQ